MPNDIVLMLFSARKSTNLKYKVLNRLILTAILAILVISLTGCNGKKQIEIHDITDRDHLLLEGIVTFNQQVDTAFVRQVLDDLFIKYIKVDFSVTNANGRFEEVVDQSLNLRLSKMVHGSDIESDDYYYEFQQFCRDWSYFYSIEIDRLKLTDENGALYVRESTFDYVKTGYGLHDDAEKVAQENHVVQIMFDKVRFSETGRIHLHKFFDF
ncbi:MAG: hypothetical protein HQ568_06735 [Calditrichaeota bacterium]|nr:hypothetical protein [Calditrichota bacterium]